jgi:Flp pilus assembly protein TadG
MKTLKYILSIVALITVVWSCSEELDKFDFVNTSQDPAKISAFYHITQDNTGLVTLTPNGEGASYFDIYFGDATVNPVRVKQGESVKHVYAEGNYKVKIVAYGVTGLKTEVTQDLVVSFIPPKNLVVVIENDLAVSKKVNVTANADFATFFEVYIGEAGNNTPVNANIGGTASYVYK